MKTWESGVSGVARGGLLHLINNKTINGGIVFSNK